MYHLGQHIPVDSLIHRLDPRVKILSVIGLSIMTLGGAVFTEALITVCLIALIPTSPDYGHTPSGRLTSGSEPFVTASSGVHL